MAASDEVRGLQEAINLNDQFSTVTQESTVDRELLAKAVTLSSQATLIDFAFVKQISVNNFPLIGITVADLTESISVPVSFDDFSKLKENSEKSYYGQGFNISYDPSLREALEIDGSRICCLTPENLDLSSLIIHHMGLPSTELLNVQAKLKKLVLYEIGGHYIYDSNQFGVIGTVILQIPVEKGHEGGNWEVEHNGISQLFMTDSNSDKTFYLSSFYGKCKHSMKKVTKGCKLSLVFDLVCKNAKTIIPSNFPVFLTALKEVKQSLNPWMRVSSNGIMSSNESFEKSLKEHVLFFDLQETYEKRDLSFQLLRGKDRNLAQLLQCCSFLDLHLVNFTQQKAKIAQPHDADGENSYGDAGQEFFWQWIDTDDIIRNLSIKLDWEQQRVGCFQPCVNSSTVLQEIEKLEIIQESDSTSLSTTVKRFSYRSVLVIWPKDHSVGIYCRYGLPSLISRMENLLASTSHWREEERQAVTQDLHQLIYFCCAQPKVVWSNLEMQKGELTSKLLNFCVTLRAREEGLALLKVLGTDFEEDCQDRVEIDTKAFEGIQNEQVAEAIAKFQCQISGWQDMAELVEKMITPNRISKQLIPIIKLTECLLEVNCVEGATMIGDCISSSFINMEHGTTASQASKVTHYCVQAYLGMVLSLERNPMTSDRTRMEHFVIFFSRLRSSVQCRLVLDLEAQNRNLFKIDKSCVFMYNDMCRILSTDCNIYVPPVKCIAVDLLRCYIRLGNIEWLQSLINQICRPPLPSEITVRFNATKLNLLATLVSSSALWELAESAEPIKTTMIVFVNTFLLLLVDHFSTQIEIHNLIPAIPEVDISRHETLLKSLSPCILFFRQMELTNYSMKSNHLSVIYVVLNKLTIHQFFHFLIDLFRQLATTQHYLNNGIIRDICEFLLYRMKEKVIEMPRREDILDVMKCFIQTGDELLIRSLLEQVCANEITGFWPYHDKHRLFKNFVSLFDVWGKLTAANKSMILDTCNHIVINGINDVIRKLDATSASTEITPILFECVQLFFLAEKNRFSDVQCCVAHVFQPLLAKLSNSLLMNLVLNVFVWGKNEYPSIKKILRIYKWYRDTCRRFFSLNFVPLVKSEVEMAVKILNCLLWLNDETCWKNFSFQICESFPSEESNLFVIVIASSDGIRKALLDSLAALNAFVTILDHWIDTLNSTAEPPFSWKQPKAVVHGHPRVEAFLRSDEERMTYFQFTSTKEARRFCAELNANGPLNGCSVKVSIHSKNYSSRNIPYCEIVKNRSHHNKLLQEFSARKTEVEGLDKLRKSFLEERAKVNAKLLELRCLENTDESKSRCEIACDANIVYQSTAAKRKKMAVPLIVID